MVRRQRAILDWVWSNGPATAEQLREALLPAHRLKDSSVRTLLRRLEVRGYVSHRLDGKTYVYEATMARCDDFFRRHLLPTDGRESGHE